MLDVRRLGKQRVETLQILRALTFEDYGWRNHPAVRMWRGYTDALVTYGAAMVDAWETAGFSDRVGPQLLEFLDRQPLRTQAQLAQAGLLPSWLGSRRLHRSHQAALVRKDPDHYGRLFAGVDPEQPYVWPPAAPPAAPPVAPVSAWVVRMEPDHVADARALQVVALRPAAGEGPDAPAGVGARNTKRRRQMLAFVDEMLTLDRIVVPAGEALLVGQVVGDYEWRHVAGALHHTRPVRWLGEVRRSDLTRPVYLQDPRSVFALRDEPRVGAAV